MYLHVSYIRLNLPCMAWPRSPTLLSATVLVFAEAIIVDAFVDVKTVAGIDHSFLTPKSQRV